MSTPAKDRAWKDAHATATAAADLAADALIRALPVGRAVVWRHGKYLQAGEIIAVSAHGYCYHAASVKVRANSSGREYWIHAYRIRGEL